jgi:hypothetical protein
MLMIKLGNYNKSVINVDAGICDADHVIAVRRYFEFHS